MIATATPPGNGLADGPRPPMPMAGCRLVDMGLALSPVLASSGRGTRWSLRGHVPQVTTPACERSAMTSSRKKTLKILVILAAFPRLPVGLWFGNLYFGLRKAESFFEALPHAKRLTIQGRLGGWVPVGFPPPTPDSVAVCKTVKITLTHPNVIRSVSRAFENKGPNAAVGASLASTLGCSFGTSYSGYLRIESQGRAYHLYYLGGWFGSNRLALIEMSDVSFDDICRQLSLRGILRKHPNLTTHRSDAPHSRIH